MAAERVLNLAQIFVGPLLESLTLKLRDRHYKTVVSRRIDTKAGGCRFDRPTTVTDRRYRPSGLPRPGGRGRKWSSVRSRPPRRYCASVTGLYRDFIFDRQSDPTGND